MPGIQTNLQRKPYTRQYKISKSDIAVNTVGRALFTALMGALTGFMCYIGFGISKTIFGRVLLPGLFQLPVKMLAAVLPAGLVSFSPMLILALPLVITAGVFLYSMSNELGRVQQTRPLQNEEENHFLYAIAGWVLPIALFSLVLSNGILALNAALWLVCGAAALGNAYWTLVTPTLKDMTLLQEQELQFIKEEAKEKPEERQVVPGPSITPQFNHERRQTQSMQQIARPAPSPMVTIIDATNDASSSRGPR